MSRKAYRIELIEADRTWLLEFIGRGAAPAREQTRARVLLKADEGPEGPAWPEDWIADALELSVGGTKGIRRCFAERGLKGCVKRKKPDREYERKLDGERRPGSCNWPAQRPRRAAASGACAFWPTTWLSLAS